MTNDNCNSVANCGQGSCTDDDSYVKLKSTQPKIISKLTDIEATLDNFSQSLAIYCQLEQQNLTDIDSKLSEVININAECCNIINIKLSELITVIEGKEQC
jgi:hypothetical protein